MTSHTTLREDFEKRFTFTVLRNGQETRQVYANDSEAILAFIESELSSSATKIREEIRTMEREGGELEPYLEVVKTKNMDKMFDYAYEKARRDILALLPSEGESKEK